MEIREQFAGISSLFPSCGDETEVRLQGLPASAVPGKQAQCPRVCVVGLWMCYCLMSILPSRLHEKKPFLLLLLNLAHFPNTWNQTEWYVPHERHEASSFLLLYNVSFSRLNLAVVLFPCISNHASPIHHLAYLSSGTSNTELFVLVQVKHLFKLFIYILHH